MSAFYEGGCQCGKVRYRVELDSHDAYLCHCRMCQRATGGVSVPFINLRKEKREWLTEADWFESSEIARRPFCARCGTALGFEYFDSENCDITVGSMDNPEGFKPISHFGTEGMHRAWIDTSALPQERAVDNEKLADRWKKAIGRIPE